MHRHPELLTAARSRLAVVDMQPRLLAGIADADAVTARVKALRQAARLLDVPVVATEQNPEKLGESDPQLELQDRRGKMAFSAADALDLGDRTAGLALNTGDRDQVVLCGVETGICVLQTAMDLLAAGWSVTVVEDACGSRRKHDAAVAVRRMSAVGVQIATTEMVLFEWVGEAGTDAFREVSRLVKSLA